jgi:biuret amidohydrolase
LSGKDSLNVPRTLEEVCDPRHMALLVYDMQVGIASQLPHGSEITSRVAEVLSAAREGSFPVFFSRYVSLPKELMGVFQLRQRMLWQRVDTVEEVRSPFPPDAPHSSIVPELEPLPSEAVSERIAMSAFEGTFLNAALRDLGINSFAICGIATEVGIEPTIRHAADLGYIPVVVEDACGAGNKAAGERSLEILKFAGDALFTDSATIGTLFRSPNRRSSRSEPRGRQ